VLTFSVNKNINDVITQGTLADARPTTDYGREWWSEVWIKALEGNVDDQVNIDAYGYTCERNTKMVVAQKEVALVTAEELEMGVRGVADTVASYFDLNIDTLIESTEVVTLVEEFLQVHEMLAVEEGINLWKVMTLARQQNAKMVEKFRDIISRHSLGSLIEGVLRNRECLAKLEGVMA
jgi:hypothetical protein